MERDLRELAVAIAAQTAATETLSKNVDSIFRILNGSGESKGLVTKIELIKSDTDAIWKKISSMESDRRDAKKGRGAIILGVVSAVTAIICAFIAAIS